MGNDNLVYVTVYGKKDYFKLFNLLYVSLALIGGRNCNFSLLIMTCQRFKEDIERTVYSVDTGIKAIIFETCERESVFDAALARYYIFDFDGISQYKTILYLDADILINGPIWEVFTGRLSEGRIYCYPEGELINDYSDFYGRSIFIETGKEEYLSRPGFSSGVLLFRNELFVREVFREVIDRANERRERGLIFSCFDQPLLNFLLTSQNMVDLTLLMKYVVNNPNAASPDTVINHFPGGPGNFSSKFSKMSKFLLRMLLRRLSTDHLPSLLDRLFLGKGETEEVVFLNEDLFHATLIDGTTGILLVKPGNLCGLFLTIPSFDVFPLWLNQPNGNSPPSP